jgi:hypothetical protein
MSPENTSIVCKNVTHQNELAINSRQQIKALSCNMLAFGFATRDGYLELCGGVCLPKRV